MFPGNLGQILDYLGGFRGIWAIFWPISRGFRPYLTLLGQFGPDPGLFTGILG